MTPVGLCSRSGRNLSSRSGLCSPGVCDSCSVCVVGV